MTDDKDFDSAWFSSYSNKNLIDNFNEIKTYAYTTFDALDLDKNGFIDKDELRAAFNSPSTGDREKSFISFLLTNHEAIAEAGEEEHIDGISRKDIAAYFDLITSLMS